ncbi:AraC family transcriptional regulator [Flavobacterium sp. P4023]|uniref:AraC family transcriptional regulator n=1 Tax=Flavobacterium flabelliforme TaxID=2816119 RepID=A0ABS5CV85_9FLAO|nr:helix-turn-helix domain-containing protein [Flavobacterium flabelliforme]MBP4142526.1 AraC family transcriptional regulator [Flavobacterium flabelliforme]
MTAVKTYKSINSNQENLHFSIAKMQDIYKLRNGKVDEPHRHNFYSVLIINKAKGIHKIDFNSYEFSENQIFFIAPGQVHQVIENEKSEGFSMTFSNQFLVENSIPISFIESLNLFQNYGQSPPLQLESKDFESIENFANEIVKLFNSNAAMKFLSIGSFLKLILIACNTSCAINPMESDIAISGASLIRNFKNAVNQNFKKEHSTTFYASQLFISPDHLNRTFKAKVGKTAKEFIQARIITEAKRLLFFSSLTNKEIAYQLGFKEPANFSAFFKKHTKLSPSHFKKREIK